MKVPNLSHGTVQGLQTFSKLRRSFSFGRMSLFPVPPDSAARKITYTFALGHQIHREFMDSFTPHPAATLCTMHNKGISPRIASTCSSKCYPALPKDGGTKESVQMVCSCCLQNTQLTWWHNMNPSPGKIPRQQIILGKFCVL